MKTGILTFHWTINYGGILQAYALQQIVKGLGSEVEFINYENSREILKSMSFKRKIIHHVWEIFARIFFGRLKREKLTDQFRRKYLEIAEKKCKNLIELSSLPNYDVYIIGSDQVWNPDLTHNPNVYLLSFVDDVTKIAYAASFGKASIDNKYYALYSKELKKFDKISVREEDALPLLHEMDIDRATVVLDPTLLLSKEDWFKIETPRIVKTDYILCYYMPTSDGSVERSIRAVAHKLKKISGYKIINIGKKEYEKIKFYENNYFNTGPAEFVSLVHYARYIITNSFHGTAFALKMNIPFYSVINLSVEKENRLSNRIECLLEKFMCTERIIDSSSRSILNVNAENFDFTNVNRIMQEQSAKSIEFLKDSLRRNRERNAPI